MKYDFSKPILSIFGEPVKLDPSPGAKDMTLQDAAITALISPNEDRDSFANKAKLFDLACRIRDNPAGCELKSEEVTLIKNAVGRIYGPVVCGPIEHLLEGESGS